MQYNFSYFFPSSPQELEESFYPVHCLLCLCPNKLTCIQISVSLKILGVEMCVGVWEEIRFGGNDISLTKVKEGVSGSEHAMVWCRDEEPYLFFRRGRSG